MSKIPAHNFFCKGFMIFFFLFFLCGLSVAQEDQGLTSEEKIKKARELYSLGNELLEKENYTQADETFKKAQQLMKDSVPEPRVEKESVSLGPLVKKAVEHDGKGEYQEAIIQYARAIENCPNNADLQYNLSVEYIKAGRWNEAVEALERVVSLNPKDKDAYYNLGVLYDGCLGDKKKAIFYYLNYIRLAPRADDVAQVKAVILQMNKDQGE